MAFHDDRFPTTVALGSAGGAGFNTSLVEVDSGAIDANARWGSAGRRQFSFPYPTGDQARAAELITFHIARNGSANAFPVKHYSDFSTGANHTGAVSNTDVEIATGDGSTTAFQLIKKYSSGSYTVTRAITKAVTSTVVVALDGVNQASGWSVSRTTGMLTFSTAPGIGVSITAGFEFDVPARFTRATDQLLSVQQDYRSVTSIAGTVELVEDLEDHEATADRIYGGSYDHGLLVGIHTALVSDGRFQIYRSLIAPSGTQRIELPDPNSVTVPTSPDVFTIASLQSTEDIDIYNPILAGTIATISNGEAAIIGLAQDSSGTYTYFAVVP